MKLGLISLFFVLISSVSYAQDLQESANNEREIEAGAACLTGCKDEATATNVPDINRNRAQVEAYVASLVRKDSQTPAGSKSNTGDK